MPNFYFLIAREEAKFWHSQKSLIIIKINSKFRLYFAELPKYETRDNKKTARKNCLYWRCRARLCWPSVALRFQLLVIKY